MRILRKAISGTEGARTHVQRAGGCVAYQRPCPVNRNTVAQCRRRGIFANAAREWSKLSELNRRKVAELAAAERRIDSLGHPTRVLPFNYFCRARMRGEQIPPFNAAIQWINEHCIGWSFVDEGVFQMDYNALIPRFVESILTEEGAYGVVFTDVHNDEKIFKYVEAGTNGIQFSSDSERPLTLTRGVWRFPDGWEYPLAGLPQIFS